MSGGAPPFWAVGVADMVPFLWGTDGGDHAVWQERYSYMPVDSTSYV